jgi:hypothetical protein
MASQWERLLKNQGTWVGSFTQMSTTGTVLDDIPTEVSLQPLDNGNTMCQVVRKYPPGQPVDETTLEYRSLGRGVLLCETGAFSQGALQWSPVSDFGAELGLIHQAERLRMALTFPRQPTLGGLILIREHLKDAKPELRPDLSLDQLLGTWIGQATTVFPDWQPEQSMDTQLTLRSLDAGIVEQSLQFSGAPSIRSQGIQDGQRLQFQQGQQPMTVLMLPNGASATFPASIQPGRPLFLEVGWLIEPHFRQRLIRRYDSRGTLASLTLVTEHWQS